MHWLLQDKFNHDPKYRELIKNLERLDIPYTMCKVVPFTDDGIEFPEGISYETFKDIPVFTYGSYTLAKIAKKHFKPASFISPKIGIDHLLEHYGDEMFNNDMIIAPIKDLDTDMEQFFIRPVEDTKSFCGEVMTLDNFREWKSRILKASEGGGYSTVTADTMVVIASRKPINKEYRFFIVNKKIATCSQYRWNRAAQFIEGAEPFVEAYVNKMIHHWSPDYAFCMDIAVVGDTPKILEINSINASGMYKIDTQKFIMAVEGLHDCTSEYDHTITLAVR
jgi:hypothetical protein